MLYNDFAKTKEYLKTQLPEYLRNKGINPEVRFCCLNPNHDDRHPSMSYNPNNYTVHCFSCNETYDIFALIGIDFGLTDFKDQFNKACELFLNSNDEEYIDDNDNLRVPNRNYDSDEHDNEPLPFSPLQSAGPVSFGITEEKLQDQPGDRKLGNPVSFDSFKTQNLSSEDHGISVHNFSAINDINEDAPDEFNTFHPTQRAVFGIRDSFKPTPSNNSSNSFGVEERQFSDFHTEVRPNYSEYLKQCVLRRNETNYLKQRGISDSVAEKFRIGFDSEFQAGIDSHSGDKIIWKAVIIPYSEQAYMARNTDFYSKDRIRKHGLQGIFNQKALENPGTIFITEGEFDALSIETLGFSAISLGGISNVKRLLDLIQNNPVYDRMFYIALDDDAPGIEAANALAKGLEFLRVPFKRINIAFPFKDPNEALCKDRQGLQDRLHNLEKLLSFSLQNVPLAPKTYSPILNAATLYSLKLSPAIYSLSGKNVLLKRLVAEMISAKVQTDTRIVYVGTKEQWNILCSLFKRRDQYENGAVFAPWNRARLLEIKEKENLATAIEEAIIALHIQGEKNFCPIIDLTILDSKSLNNFLLSLNQLMSGLGTPCIVLCNENESITAEAYAVQNIEISLNDKNDLSFFTYDLLGRDINFSIY